MSGTLHADWLCDEKALGFEGRHIPHCKFTFAPELSTRPILSDTYKRLPTLVTQKLRNPHIDLVFNGTFGRRIRFLATNFAPKMPQRDDEVGSLVNRTVCVRFSKKRTPTWIAHEVEEENGVFRVHSDSHLRENALSPSVRRAFYRFWANFSRDFPISACEEMAQGLRLVDSASGPNLQGDTESLCAQMIGGKDHTQKESHDADGPVPSADIPRAGRNRDQELRDSVEMLRRVRRATASDANVRAYKICALPDTVLPGIRALRSSKNKPTKMRNFTTAPDIVSASDEVQSFRKAGNGPDFHRLDGNLSDFERNDRKRYFRRSAFAGGWWWGGVFAIRYDANQDAITDKSLDPPGLPQDPVPVREVLNLEKLREYLQYRPDKDSEQIDSILSASTPVEGDEHLGPLVAMYSNTSAYGGKYARSASWGEVESTR